MIVEGVISEIFSIRLVFSVHKTEASVRCQKQLFQKIIVLRNFVKFRGKYLCRSLFLKTFKVFSPFIEHLLATASDKVNMSPFTPNSQKAYLLLEELDPFFK